MRKTNQELHRAIQADMKDFLQKNRSGTIQQWATTSEWTRDTVRTRTVLRRVNPLSETHHAARGSGTQGGERDANGAPVRVTTGIFLELFSSVQQEVAMIPATEGAHCSKLFCNVVAAALTAVSG